MARRIQILLEDDLTGELLEHGRGETVHFGLDGTSYDIDLSGANARILQEALRRYISAARRVTGHQLARAGSRRSATTGREPSIAARRR